MLTLQMSKKRKASRGALLVDTSKVFDVVFNPGPRLGGGFE
jgi:hypothetical protein